MKIPVPSLAKVRGRLRERGGRRLESAALEDNWVLDDGGRSLAAAGRLLRVRCVGTSCLITLKGPPSFSRGVKTRTELETGVADAETALAILAGLGFGPVRRYQKRRETWSFGGVTVALDETPMGSFVELEGEAAALAEIAGTLGLDPHRAARGTYLDLWAAFRTAHQDAPEDMVFEPDDGHAGRPA